MLNATMCLLNAFCASLFIADPTPLGRTLFLLNATFALLNGVVVIATLKTKRVS